MFEKGEYLCLKSVWKRRVIIAYLIVSEKGGQKQHTCVRNVFGKGGYLCLKSDWKRRVVINLLHNFPT